MKNKSHDRMHIISLGLALFAMFFGAGNLMYPVMVGLESGDYTSIGLLGFMITAVLFPCAGLLAMILFDGNYHAFFNRLGHLLGGSITFFCMLIIGPALAIPRIITLSHVMIAPSLPASLQIITPTTSFTFALIFLVLTYLATYRENRIVDFLGYIISPLLLASLGTIIGKGLSSAHEQILHTYSPLKTFSSNFTRGYETLDLLAAVFLSSIAFRIVKNKTGGIVGFKKNHAYILICAGIVSALTLATVYTGLAYLGSYLGHNLISDSNLFRRVSVDALGNYGSMFAVIAVLTACFSTAMTLSAVVAEYVQLTIFRNHIKYEKALLLVLILCMPLSTFGLDYVLELSNGPLTYIGYPVFITLTACNIAYKIWNFRPLITPILITFIGALILYFY